MTWFYPWNLCVSAAAVTLAITSAPGSIELDQWGLLVLFNCVNNYSIANRYWSCNKSVKAISPSYLTRKKCWKENFALVLPGRNRGRYAFHILLLPRFRVRIKVFIHSWHCGPSTLVEFRFLHTDQQISQLSSKIFTQSHGLRLPPQINNFLITNYSQTHFQNHLFLAKREPIDHPFLIKVKENDYKMALMLFKLVSKLSWKSPSRVIRAQWVWPTHWVNIIHCINTDNPKQR